jgi:hypothetical protein
VRHYNRRRAARNVARVLLFALGVGILSLREISESAFAARAGAVNQNYRLWR